MSQNHKIAFFHGTYTFHVRVFAAFLFVLLFMSAESPLFSSNGIGVSEGGVEQSVREVLHDAGLPTIYIYTENGENPTFTEIDAPEGMLGASIKDNAYVKGYCEIADLDSGRSFACRMKLKVRGNTSVRNEDLDGKLPYKLVLKEAVDLFGNGHWDKRYVLLAYAGEILNTYLGFLIGRYCGMEWTPECRYINLVLNDDYKGIYMIAPALDGVSLSEHVGPNGFMIECDTYWWKEDVYFKTGAIDDTMAYTVKYPEAERLTDARLEQMREYMDALEEDISEDGFSDLIDEETFIAWIMSRDIMGEGDDAGANIYYYLKDYDLKNPKGSKLRMGPLWDFDSDFICVDAWSSYMYSNTTYFPRLLSEDRFSGLYVDRWRQISPFLYTAMETELQKLEDSDGNSINASRTLDAQRWGRPLLTLEEEAEEKLAWLKARIDWMDAELAVTENGGLLRNRIYVTLSEDGRTMNILFRDDGYDQILFPTWSDEDGQDDLIWWNAHLNEDGNWECQVDLSRHHSKGMFCIHVYGKRSTEDNTKMLLSAKTFIPHAVEPDEMDAAG